jgi:hypothetical protein
MKPLCLHPQNPHYFLFREKPTLLITSAEHYGAVINLDFATLPYLDALAAYGMNCTRIYAGAYLEPVDYFIQDNTLGPRPNRQLLPWARSKQPGYPLGGNLFDLDRWDEVYFKRLCDFIAEAGQRGIVVEICLFNAAYPDTWASMPLYHANNLQGVGTCECKDVQTLKDTALVQRHEAYVRKLTQEVNRFDNVILEICDEPGLHGTQPEDYSLWISRLIDVIVETEQALPYQHLIAQQVCGNLGGSGDFSADARVGVIVGQYVGPTDGKQFGGNQLLDAEYGWKKPIELNETAFYPIWYQGDREAASRVEAWEFIVGGGASFNHLNGLFSTSNPAAKDTNNPVILGQLQNLSAFIHSLEFLAMRADPRLTLVPEAEGLFARGMSEEGRQYAWYLHHSRSEQVKYIVLPGNYQDELGVEVPAGHYHLEWLDPASLRVMQADFIQHPGGVLTLVTPRYAVDIALRMRKGQS